MRKPLIAIVALALLISSALVIWCSCGTSRIIGNVTGYQAPISTVPYTDYWETGNGVNVNSANIVPNLVASSGGYYVDTGTNNWQNGGNGCPMATSRMTFLYSIPNNGSAQFLPMTVNSSGTEFDFGTITNGPGNTPSPIAIPAPTIFNSTKNADGSYDLTLQWAPLSNLKGYYDVGTTYSIGDNGLGTVSATSTTKLTSVTAKSWATNIWAGGTLTWLSSNYTIVSNTGNSITVSTAMPSGTDLSYSLSKSGLPVNNIVTGMGIYFWQNASGTTPPTDFSLPTGGWILASGGPNSRPGYVSWGLTGSDSGTAIVHVPGPIPSGQAIYLAMSVLFDGALPGDQFFGNSGIPGRETYYVGPASAQVGPTPAGIFAGFDAKLAMGTVTATWRSNAESGLAFYQVYASKLVGGPYVPINGTLTSPMGDSHVYTATFPFPKEIGKRKVFLKVKATDMDGTEWWTQPVKVVRRTEP